MSGAEWSMAAPVLALLGAALAVVTYDLFAPPAWGRGAIEALTYLGLIAAIPLLFLRGSGVGFGGAIIADDLSRFISLAVVVATVLTAVVSWDSLGAKRAPMAEFAALLLTAAAGMMLLVMSYDLITMFLSVEILSLALYVLCGITRADGRSNESAMKYFILGAFATGFLLYGMALIYGSAGTVFFEAMGAKLHMAPPALVLAGLGLLVAGFAFKIGAAPFHMWVPDVYEGAPTPVTAFMSVAVKAAGFGALVRLVLDGMPGQSAAWLPLVWGLAALTMIVGNLGALTQTSVKRMLAYSSIAHTGYALIGLAAAQPGLPDGPAASIFYTAVYTVMTLGAFVFLMFAGRPGREAETYDDLAGLGRRRPWAAAFMTVLMVSLAGIPPTAGFFGKFMLFKASVDAGQVGLAILGVVTSVVSVAYYLRVVVAMYMKEGPHGEEASGEGAPAYDATTGLAVGVSALLTLALGLFPGWALDFSRSAVERLLH
jgi:NADH-quinone oxidoreductase subunit N